MNPRNATKTRSAALNEFCTLVIHLDQHARGRPDPSDLRSAEASLIVTEPEPKGRIRTEPGLRASNAEKNWEGEDRGEGVAGWLGGVTIVMVERGRIE